MSETGGNDASFFALDEAEANGLLEVLKVGSAVFLDLNQARFQGGPIRSTLRGWEFGSFIMVEKTLPQHGITPQRGHVVKVRILHDGEIWFFETKVADPRPDRMERLMQLEWPEAVNRIRLRRSERVKMSVPCLMRLANFSVTKGILCDLSAGGCCIQSAHVVDTTEEFELSFRMPDGAMVEGLRTRVCKEQINPSGERRYGCSFDEEDSERMGIRFGVSRLLAKHRQEEMQHPISVVVTENPKDVAHAQAIMALCGCELLEARHVLDLGYFCRMYAPRVVFIDMLFQELQPTEICRMLRHTPSYSRTRLILFGPGSAELAAQCAYTVESIRSLLDLREEFVGSAPPEMEITNIVELRHQGLEEQAL